MKRTLSSLAVLIVAATLVAADPPEPRAALNQYYADPVRYQYGQGRVAPWEKLVGRLGSKDAGERRAGADYLRKLLALALTDELSDKALSWHSPVWSAGADTLSRRLRDDIAAKLFDTPPSPELVPVSQWYLENEPDDHLFYPGERRAHPIVAVLAKVDGEAADSLRAELATKPHPSGPVVVEAFQQITARDKLLPADAVAALCHHHRADVRTAARAFYPQCDAKDPGAFDPVKAVRSEPVAKVVARLTELLPDLPGADAEWVTVTVRDIDEKNAERRKTEWRGLRVKSAAGVVRILMPHCGVASFPDKQTSRFNVEEVLPDGRRQYVPVQVVTTVTAAATDPAVLVKLLVAERAKGNEGFMFTRSEFGGRYATLFEATLGVWLYRAGKHADAAAVLLPALDSLDRDDHFVRVVSLQASELVGQKMLVAFIGDRDYAAALKHAGRINALYPGTPYHRYAKGLAEQLPKRGDDFAKLKLPTPAAWAELQKKLTREQQIDYLGERVRLVNSFQSGQPGGYSLYDRQYAEPCGLSEHAAWGQNKGKTEVINPFIELLGDHGGNKMALTKKDIPRLSKYLRDDWYMPTVGFHRDFFPDRDLASTRPLFAKAINRIAGEDVCKINEWGGLTPAEIDARIAAINKAAE